MSKEDKKELFKKIQEVVKEKYNIEVDVVDPPPLSNVHFVYCLNLSTCNGNRKCVSACAEENNTDSKIGSYIKVFEMPFGSLNPSDGKLDYQGEVPRKDKFYLPTQCNHCNNPPCAKACPVKATWKESDGLVVIDYDWCIGCRMCQVACPYEARFFNFGEPKLDAENINTTQGVLSNRIRSRGVMEKCTFCLHKTRQGEFPACHNACPTGSRKFGNLLDKDSTVYKIIKSKKVFVLKSELGTIPQFFYYFDD